MGLPKHKTGDKVTVKDRSYSPPQKAKYYKKSENGYWYDYVWEGVVTGIGYDLKTLYGAMYRRLVDCNFPMLIQDYNIYYYVKQGNYHSTRVDEIYDLYSGWAFLLPDNADS